MRVEDFARLAKVVDQPLVLVSPAGQILAANPAATRLSAALATGLRIHDALVEPGAGDERLRTWLRLGGPVPARLDLRVGDETVKAEANVGRVAVADGPALLVSIRQSPSEHRFGQLTDQLQRLQQETRHRRQAEARHQAALAAEQEARQQLERLQELAAVSAATVTLRETAEAIATLAPSVVGADTAVVVLADGPAGPRVLGDSRGVVGMHAQNGRLHGRAQPLRTALDRSVTLSYSSTQQLVDEYPDLGVAGGPLEDESFLACVIPLAASPGEPPIGLIGFAATGQGLSSEQEVTAQLVAAQGAQALERARLYDNKRRTAETMQRALLPEALPETRGVDCAVRYLPAAEAEAVGGDWYAVIRLDGGRVGLAVGDVAGHGPEAATAMATMRNALRALATTSDSPSEVLAAFNRFVCSQLPEEMATCAYLVVDVHAGTLSYANAGHLPPLLVGVAPEPAYLQDVLQPPLGVAPDVTYQAATRHLAARCHLVLYTDGLIERRREPIDLGLDRLVGATLVGQVGPTDVCDHLLTTLVGAESLEDDAALLVAAITPERRPPEASVVDGAVDHSAKPPDSQAPANGHGRAPQAHQPPHHAPAARLSPHRSMRRRAPAQPGPMPPRL